jgi:hypothetical protein
MSFSKPTKKKYIVDLNTLNTHNEKGCEACNRKFNLGDTVVVAYGAWQNGCTRLIHEQEAVLDPKTNAYYERKYYQSLSSMP